MRLGFAGHSGASHCSFIRRPRHVPGAGSRRENVAARSSRASASTRPWRTAIRRSSYCTDPAATRCSPRGSTSAMMRSIDFDAAHRADAAGRAFPARFDDAELHCEARLLCHVDSIVEHNRAAVAYHGVLFDERLIVHLGIELRIRKVCAERTAELHRPQRAPGIACPRRNLRSVRAP